MIRKALLGAVDYVANAQRAAELEKYRTTVVAKTAVASRLFTAARDFKEGLQELIELDHSPTQKLFSAAETVDVLKDVSAGLESSSVLETAGQVAKAGALSFGNGVTNVAMKSLDLIDAGIKATSKGVSAAVARLPKFPDGGFVRIKELELVDAQSHHAQSVYKEAYAIGEVLIDRTVTDMGHITKATDVVNINVKNLNVAREQLTEAKKAFNKEALKFAGKAVLVAGAVVITGLAVRSLYRYFTATPAAVKSEELAVETRPRANAVVEEPVSAASSTSVSARPTPPSIPRSSSVSSSGSMPRPEALRVLRSGHSTPEQKARAGEVLGK